MRYATAIKLSICRCGQAARNSNGAGHLGTTYYTNHSSMFRWRVEHLHHPTLASTPPTLGVARQPGTVMGRGTWVPPTILTTAPCLDGGRSTAPPWPVPRLPWVWPGSLEQQREWGGAPGQLLLTSGSRSTLASAAGRTSRGSGRPCTLPSLPLDEESVR